ncbi:hypothetical protein AMECASPLE_035825 [Ameca splendens]|uniref:Uncharacterized protein n=1 Tax=Ameca splendens TaxID=208324 RepID=A0ABV1AH67_9TELE
MLKWIAQLAYTPGPSNQRATPKNQSVLSEQFFFGFHPSRVFLRSWSEEQQLSVEITGEADWENVQVCLSSSDRTTSFAPTYLPGEYLLPGKLQERAAPPQHKKMEF